MQFRVPQFIDMEDKIIGPFTLKQFAYLLGAGGFAFLFWTILPHFIAVLVIVPVSGLFIALAFVKVNNRPLLDMMESALTYYMSSKIYTWKQSVPEKKVASRVEKVISQTQKEDMLQKVKGDKLHDVSLGLDVLDRNPQ